MKVVPVSKPSIGLREIRGVLRSVRRGHISGLFGDEVSHFERRFAEFNGSEFAVACSSGTAALHLSLVALGIGPGDEVLVADTTNMASFFAVMYTGAKPVPIEILESSMTIDVLDAERKVTSRTRAIMPVHLFGQPCDMEKVIDLAERRRLEIVEDCAEAHGASFGGKKVGSFGIAGCFSLFANKIVTTGEGGMITTDDARFAAELRALRSLNFGDGASRFMHRGLGFNYRMTGLQAAIGIEQLRKIDWLVGARIAAEQRYRDWLKQYQQISWQSPAAPASRPVTWMSHIILQTEVKRNSLMSDLSREGIQTRPGFIPFTLQRDLPGSLLENQKVNSIAAGLAHRTLYLPTWAGISRNIQKKVVSTIENSLENGIGS